MKLSVKAVVLLLLLTPTVNAQIQALNDVVVKPRNLTQRWQLDSTLDR